MAVQFPNGFKITSQEPIDSKFVLTKAQMKTAETDLYMPNNYFCLCSEDNKIYVFNVNNPVDVTTGKFRQLETVADISEYLKSAEISENKLVLKKKDDTTVTLNLKTINNTSIIGTGNVEVRTTPAYVDLSSESSVSLSAKTTEGVYKIAHASDNPQYTSEAGLLTVEKLTNNFVKQTWYSDTNIANRSFDASEPAPETGFFVNDVRKEPDQDGIVYLSSGGVKHLRGSLIGQVKIDDQTTNKIFTTIILDGVNITSNKEAAIISNGAEARLIVEVSDGTTNVLTSTYAQAASSSVGALHSESDLTLNGNGVLSIKSVVGHGIKAKDILISGKPDITIDALHDGIHGKSIQIAGGKYYIKNANDAFSAGSDNNSGILKVSGGEITIEKCTENVFQAKKATVEGAITPKIRLFYDAKLTLLEGFSTAPVCDAGTDGSIEIYPSVTITKPASISIPWVVDITTKYAATPTVYDNDNRVAVTAVDNVFTLTSAGASYTLSGNFTGYRVVVPNAGKSLNLNGVYLNDQTDDANAFIDYTYNTGTDLKNVKIILTNGNAENFVNYLVKKNGYIIKSTNNININDSAFGSADIYMSCPNGYAIYAENEARIQNDGARYLVKSKYGIRANLVNIADELAEEDYTKNKTAMFYCCDNTEYDIALYHHAYKGEERDGRINVTANCYCAAYLGKVVKEVATETIHICAEEHEVTPTSTATFTRYPFVYVLNTSDTFTNVGNKAIILTGVAPGPTPTPSAWKVYRSFTQDELDARYVLKTTYDAKIANFEQRITALEQGGGSALNPELDANGNLKLSHTAITDAGVVNLNNSTIDANGNVTLI